MQNSLVIKPWISAIILFSWMSPVFVLFFLLFVLNSMEFPFIGLYEPNKRFKLFESRKIFWESKIWSLHIGSLLFCFSFLVILWIKLTCLMNNFSKILLLLLYRSILLRILISCWFILIPFTGDSYTRDNISENVIFLEGTQCYSQK